MLTVTVTVTCPRSRPRPPAAAAAAGAYTRSQFSSTRALLSTVQPDLAHERVLELLKLSSHANECKPLGGGDDEEGMDHDGMPPPPPPPPPPQGEEEGQQQYSRSNLGVGEQSSAGTGLAGTLAGTYTRPLLGSPLALSVG